jgi:predicted ATP-grasp superfamily ATP-dependent carboligase
MSRVFILDGMWNKSLAAVRSFGRRGFYVAAGEKTLLSAALFSKYCNKRVVYPCPLTKEEEFLDYLENELRTGAYDVVFPMELSTQILITKKANRLRLEKYTKIPFADSGHTQRINDKALLMQHAAKHGIGIPQTWFIDDIGQVEDVGAVVNYPVLIKPRISSGSRGIRRVDNRDDLKTSYLRVHRAYPFPIIQEYLSKEGDVYGVGMLLNVKSEVRASFVYKRLRSYPVSGGPSTLRESVKKDDVIKIAAELLKSVGWRGIAHVEFKIDARDGRPKLLEVNPRFWGSLNLAVESGMDFPFLLYRMAMEGDIAARTSYSEGVKCRWLIPGDILHFIANPDRWKILADFVDFKIKDDILSLRDPLPTLGRILSGVTFLYDEQSRKIIGR